MALQVTLLVLAVCLASAIASTPTRDPKGLLILPHAYSPFYRVPSMQSRYGLTQRQTNSPINPAIAEQGLGPFFGYFPNLLTQPCPACAECETCTPCDVCPLVPEAPPAAALTTCGMLKDTPVSSAPNGTIKLNIPGGGSEEGVTCEFVLVAYYPNTKVQFECTSVPSTNFFTLTPLVEPHESSGGALNVDYVSANNVLFVKVSNSQSPASIINVDCNWTNVPA